MKQTERPSEEQISLHNLPSAGAGAWAPVCALPSSKADPLLPIQWHPAGPGGVLAVSSLLPTPTLPVTAGLLLGWGCSIPAFVV